MNRSVLLIVCALALAVYMFYIEPLSMKREDLQAAMQTQLGTLARHEAFIRSTKDAVGELKARQEELAALEKGVMERADRATAFARLQGRVQDIAAEAGIRVQTIKLMPPGETHGYTELPIYLDCTGSIVNLSDFLHALDRRRASISVDALDVATAPTGELRIKIQLTGLMRS